MKLKARIFRLQHGFCAICAKPMSMNTPRRSKAHMYATIEHVLPVSLGGRNDADNYVVTHAGCNWKRGNEPACHRLVQVHTYVRRMLKEDLTKRQLMDLAA